MANKISVLIDVTVDKAVNSLKQFRTSIADADGIVNKFKAGAHSAFEGIKANAGAMALGAGTALLKYGDDIVNAGVEMEAMDAKADTVFGKSIGKIEKWAETNAGAMGLTSREAIAAGASIADLLKPMGFSEEAAAGMTTNLLDLSGALSAWSGGTRSAADVSQIFTKAMLGEREELKGLGISITEADVSARLAEKGQKNLTGATLAQAKAVATQELILEKSTDAQRAWSDGSMDGVKSANEAKSSLHRLSEVMNESLYPVLVNLVPVVTDLAESLTPVLETAAKVTTGQIGFATSSEKAAASVSELKDEIKAAGLNYDDWWVKVRMGEKTLDDLNVAIEEGTTAAMRENTDIGDKWINGMEDGRVAVEGLGHEVDNISGPMAVARDLMKQYTDRARESVNPVDAAAEATRKLDEAYKAFTDSLDQEDAFANFQTAMWNYRSEIEHSDQSTRDYKRELLETITALEDIPPETKAALLTELDSGSLKVVEETLSRYQRGVTVPVRFTPTGDAVGVSGARASGGPVNAGEAYLVGENGPEVVVPGRSGTVIPNSALGGGSSVSSGTTNVYINTTLDERGVVAVLKKYVQRGGNI